MGVLQWLRHRGNPSRLAQVPERAGTPLEGSREHGADSRGQTDPPVTHGVRVRVSSTGNRVYYARFLPPRLSERERRVLEARLGVELPPATGDET